ncbi:MAG: tail fiber domain-containing protein [Bacteroidia bacterium]|jgi:hypothetical protein|nr:tail fiber domain-containing protein [Bacteroidia bacterium]
MKNTKRIAATAVAAALSLLSYSELKAQWLVGGNTLVSSPGIFGSLNNVDVSLRRNNGELMRFTSTGVTVGGLPVANDNLEVARGIRVSDGTTSFFCRLYLTTTPINRTEFFSSLDHAWFTRGSNLNIFGSTGSSSAVYSVNWANETAANNIITATSSRFVGIRTTNPTAVFQVAGGQISQLQTGAFGNFAGGNEWIGLGIAGTQAVPINAVFGLGMARGASAGYFNLVNSTLFSGTEDLVIGFGGEGAALDANQRMRIRSIRTNGVNAPVNKDLMVFNAEGLVGVNTDPGLVAFLVDATATNLPLSNAFRAITVLTSGSFANPVAATYASIGQEGNSTVLATDIVGLRAQNPNAGLNCQVNGNTAEITWQDLQFSNNVSTASSTQNRLTFNFRNNQPANNSTTKREVMTILANGRVGINTVAPVNAGTFNVAPNNGPTVFDFYLDVNGGVRGQGFFAFSDQRFKSNIQTIENPMDRIMKMRGTSYTFRGPGTPEGSQGVQQIGFIAQELEQVVPEAVAKGDDGIYSVNYGAITPLLVEGMKVQQAQIVTQEQKITEQQSQIDALKAEIAAMKGNTITNDGVQAPLEVNPSLGSLQQNIPNPFNQQTVINFTVAQNAGVASMIIYDLNGRQIRAEQINQRGAGQFVINANELAPGMYIYTLIVDGKAADSKRMIVTE